MEKLRVLSDIQRCFHGEIISHVLRFWIIIDLGFESFTIFSSTLWTERFSPHIWWFGLNFGQAMACYLLAIRIHPCIYILNGYLPINGA